MIDLIICQDQHTNTVLFLISSLYVDFFVWFCVGFFFRVCVWFFFKVNQLSYF